MKRPSLFSRRLLSVAATVAAGVVAALAFASPASAHTVTAAFNGAACDTTKGMWQVTWQVTTGWPYYPGTITKWDVTPATDLYIQDRNGRYVKLTDTNAVLPAEQDGNVKLTQWVPANTTNLHLSVTVHWTRPNPYDATGEADGTISGSTCTKPGPPTPSPAPSHSPSPSPSATIPAVHTSTPTLPVTGVNAMAIAGAAVVLLGAGTGLLLLARRNRRLPGTK